MQNVYKTGGQQTVPMSDKETAKQDLKKLIARYEAAVAEGKVKQYNEERTKKDFILPLFKILGWVTERQMSGCGLRRR